MSSYLVFWLCDLMFIETSGSIHFIANFVLSGYAGKAAFSRLKTNVSYLQSRLIIGKNTFDFIVSQ